MPTEIRHTVIHRCTWVYLWITRYHPNSVISYTCMFTRIHTYSNATLLPQWTTTKTLAFVNQVLQQLNFSLKIHSKPQTFWQLQLPVNNYQFYSLLLLVSLFEYCQPSISLGRDLSTAFGILTTFSKILIFPCLPPWHQCKFSEHLLLAVTWGFEACRSSRFASSFFTDTGAEKDDEKYRKIYTSKYLKPGYTDNTLCTDVMSSAVPLSSSAPGMNQGMSI